MENQKYDLKDQYLKDSATLQTNFVNFMKEALPAYFEEWDVNIFLLRAWRGFIQGTSEKCLSTEEAFGEMKSFMDLYLKHAEKKDDE